MSTKKTAAEINLEEILKSEPTTNAADAAAFNPFSPENLLLDQSFSEVAGVKRLLTTVPCRRPHSQDWFRTHPAPEFRQNAAIIVMQNDQETYVVSAKVVPALVTECVGVTLHTAITRQHNIFIWPIRLPDQLTGRDMNWWISARTAADFASRRWIRIRADQNLGAYQIYEADAAALGDPQWPQDLDFWNLCEIAFKNHLIDSLDHPVIQKLQGRA
jgi:hypothetical protein